MLDFRNISFEITDGKIRITRFGNLENLHSNFAEVQIAGENKISYMGAKMACTSEGSKLEYVSHDLCGDIFTVTQRSSLIEISTRFTTYGDTNALRVSTSVRNISTEPIVLEEVSAFAVTGIPFNSEFTRFLQGHHKHCKLHRETHEDLLQHFCACHGRACSVGAHFGSL